MTERPSLTAGLERRTYLACLLSGVLGWGACLAVSRFLLLRSSDQQLLEQAGVCARFLEPGPGGDLSGPIRKLREADPRFVAVASLDADGRVVSTHPAGAYPELLPLGRPPNSKVSIGSYLNLGRGGRFIVATVPLVADGGRPSQRVAMVLRGDALQAPEPIITGCVGFVMAVAAFVGLRPVNRWCRRHVAEPMMALAQPLGLRTSDDPANGGRPPPAWRELEQIADQIGALTRELADARAHAAQVERRLQWDLKEREEGFHRRMRRAEDQVNTDPLTRLRNRGFLERELERIFGEQRSRGFDLAVVMLDVDHFKTHNDTFGHRAGDDILRFVGELLRGATRPTDYAVRYGGDEFVLILPGSGESDARSVAERITKLFRQFSSTLPGDPVPSLSAGVATLRGSGETTGHGLVHSADLALYDAKRSGKNTVACRSAATAR